MRFRITFWQWFIGLGLIMPIIAEITKFYLLWSYSITLYITGMILAFGIDSLKDHYIEWKKTR